jgi:two-component system, chemotaxis family, CheB/CheR fusion protein
VAGFDDNIRDDAFEALFGYLKESRGFDFTAYKRTSLMRRVRRRMSKIGIDDFGDTAVDQRRTRDHERGVAVDGRGTGNDQRRTAVDQ